MKNHMLFMYLLTLSSFQGKIYAGLRYEYITLQHVFREEDKESRSDKVKEKFHKDILEKWNTPPQQERHW